MNKLNLILFYHLGKEMRTLREANKSPHRALNTLVNKYLALDKFLIETNEVPFPNTRKAAIALRHYLSNVFSKETGEDGVLIVSQNEDLKMKSLLTEFEQEFDHDSREINILSVPNRCAYSTTILIENGESLLPPEVRNAVTDYVRNELHEAGKCLAFNVSTAAGFHLARGLESALRSYYDVLSGRAARPTTKSGNDVAMVGYINQVRQWAEPKVISTLEQFTNLHRNPINHPEAVLSDEEALTLVGITVSAIAGMVTDVKTKGHPSLS
jgi:hypothetical protein